MLAYDELQGSSGREVWYRAPRYDARKLFPHGAPRVQVGNALHRLQDISLGGMAIMCGQNALDIPDVGEIVPIAIRQSGYTIFESKALVCRRENALHGSKLAFSFVNAFIEFDRLLARNTQARIAAQSSLTTSTDRLVPKDYRLLCADALKLLGSYRDLLDEHQVLAGQFARNFDIVYHQMGSWITNQSRLPPGKSWAPPASPGYNHFQNAIARTLAKGETITMPTQVSEGYSPALTLTAVDAPLEIISGFGILKTTEDRIPLLVQRQQGRTAVCVWAVSIDGSPVILKVSNLADLEGRPIAATDGLLVHARAESRDWWVIVNPEQKALVAKPAERAPFQVNSAVSIR